MKIKLTYSIEIDESKYPNLKKSEIREIVKTQETYGSTIDYIESETASLLEQEDYDKGECCL